METTAHATAAVWCAVCAVLLLASIVCWCQLPRAKLTPKEIQTQLHGALAETSRAIETQPTGSGGAPAKLSPRTDPYRPSPEQRSANSLEPRGCPSVDSAYTSSTSVDADSSAPAAALFAPHLEADGLTTSSESSGSSTERDSLDRPSSSDEDCLEEMTSVEMDDFAAVLEQSADAAPKKRQSFRQMSACDWPEQDLWSSRQYTKFLESACREWEALGPARTRHVKSLYCFWGYRLRKNFDLDTYCRFKEMAVADAKAGTDQAHRYGLEVLCRFYSYGLEMCFQEPLFADFQAVTIEDYERGQLYALEKFWAFLYYNQNEHKQVVSPKLDKILQNYTCIGDFHKHTQKRVPTSRRSRNSCNWGSSSSGGASRRRPNNKH